MANNGIDFRLLFKKSPDAFILNKVEGKRLKIVDFNESAMRILVARMKEI